MLPRPKKVGSPGGRRRIPSRPVLRSGDSRDSPLDWDPPPFDLSERASSAEAWRPTDAQQSPTRLGAPPGVRP
jgi:hypothetical protein